MLKTVKKPPNTAWSFWVENAKNMAQIAALFVAGIWSYYTLVKPELFRPDDYRPHLNLETRVESLRVLPDRNVVTLGINATNRSKRFIRNLGAHYELLGFTHSPVLQDIDPKVIANALNKDPRALIRWNRFKRTPPQRVSIGRILPDKWWFAPGEDYTKRLVVMVPSNVDVLQMNLSFRYDHANSEVFRVKWSENDGNLWYRTEVKLNGQYVPHRPSDDDKHKQIGNDHGLQWTVSTTEIDIPRASKANECHAASSTKHGGDQQ